MNTIEQLGEEQAFVQIIGRTIAGDFVDDILTALGKYAFYECAGITSVDLPNVVSLGASAFQNCRNISSVNLPNLTTIMEDAFTNCNGLTLLDFPKVNYIHRGAFNYCRNITTLILRNSSVARLAGSYGSLPSNTIIYVPDDLVDSYKAASGWSSYASSIKGISELPTGE